MTSANTLAGALGIDELDIEGLRRYHVGSETPRPKAGVQPTSPSPYLGPAETDARLATYALDAKAGVPDAAIARKSGLSPHQVARWRRRQGIERRPGRPTSGKRASVMAIDMFGRATPPTVMPVASPVSGAWTPPEYLLRPPLNYEHFAQVVMALLEAAIPSKRIASGLGVRVRDIEQASLLWAARGKR